MSEDMKKFLQDLLNSTDDLLGIVITDRDGVPLLKVSTENAPELGMRPAFLSIFGMATDQAGKLGMGKNKRMVCMYGNYQFVHFNKLPLLVTVIGTSTANTGLLMELEDHFSDIVTQLSPVVDIS